MKTIIQDAVDALKDSFEKSVHVVLVLLYKMYDGIKCTFYFLFLCIHD